MLFSSCMASISVISILTDLAPYMDLLTVTNLHYIYRERAAMIRFSTVLINSQDIIMIHQYICYAPWFPMPHAFYDKLSVTSPCDLVEACTFDR